jgi:hypothetical protein
MSSTLIDIYNGQPGATDTTLYTCPVGSIVKITSATVTNDTTTAKYISAHRVPSGGSVGDANIITNQKPVGSRESVALWELVGQVLEAGDFISAIAETASQLTVHVSGTVIVN